MSPEERSAFYRVLAAGHRKKAAEYDLAAAMEMTTVALSRLGRAWQSGVDSDIAAHPDLAELNVQMDGFYT